MATGERERKTRRREREEEDKVKGLPSPQEEEEVTASGFLLSPGAPKCLSFLPLRLPTCLTSFCLLNFLKTSKTRAEASTTPQDSCRSLLPPPSFRLHSARFVRAPSLGLLLLSSLFSHCRPQTSLPGSDLSPPPRSGDACVCVP